LEHGSNFVGRPSVNVMTKIFLSTLTVIFQMDLG